MLRRVRQPYSEVHGRFRFDRTEHLSRERIRPAEGEEPLEVMVERRRVVME